MWKKIRHFLSPSNKKTEGREQPASYYDVTFQEKNHWKAHYSASHYYPLWSTVADRVQRAQVTRVLDLGCGPGQVASLLKDRGIEGYIGVDFSPDRIRQARTVCPGFTFIQADIMTNTSLEDGEYDCVLALEFLEHIKQDLEILNRVRLGAHVFATVPNFPDPAHVRFFKRKKDVYDRYKRCFSNLEVTEYHGMTPVVKYYLIEGIR